LATAPALWLGAWVATNPHGLILYDHPSSPCARRVRITLIEKGLDWETQIIDLSRLEQRRSEYLRLNPNGVVPTLAHGERVIYESNVITEYLDDAFPEVALYPHDAWELAQVKQWQAAELAMAKDYRPLMYQRLMGPMVRLTRTLDEALAAVRLSTSAPADLAWEARVWNLAVLGADEEARVEQRLWAWLGTLDRHLDGRAFLVGERFTQAEISVFPRVMMYAFVQLPIGAERFPNVARWMQSLTSRRSFASTLSDADAQLLKLSRSRLLPWLGRTLRKPRPSPFERLRLAVVRRAVRRGMNASRAAAERTRGAPPLRLPSPGEIAPREVQRPRVPAAPPEVATAPLTLYDDPRSPHGRRIRLLLREKSLRWETVHVPLHLDAHKTAEYLAINPNGEVPALRHGERVLYDSQVIAEYLDRIYPGNPLYPENALERAQVRMWLALEAGTHKELRPLFLLHVTRPARHAAGLGDVEIRFDTSEEMARDIVRAKLDLLEAHLRGRDYLVGDTCSMADLGWFTRIDMLPHLGVEIEEDRYPNVLRWQNSIAARPSAREEPNGTKIHREPS
jgi:glutathione S-transferase